MLATVLLDPPTALLAGAVLGLASFRFIAADPTREVRRTAWLGGAWGVWYGLCVGWMFFEYPGWMMAYLKDASELSLPLVYPAFLAACGLFGAMGGLTSGHLVSRRAFGWAFAFALAALALVAAVFWLQWEQYGVIGDLDDYQRGAAVPLVEHPRAMRVMNLAAIPAVAGAIVLLGARLLRRPQPSAAR